MGADLIVAIHFDDNSPTGAAAFAMAPSVWSLHHDFGLVGCKDYRFIGAISGIRNDAGKEPLISPRGPPAWDTPYRDDFNDEPNVGWLTLPEILACLQHHSVFESDLHRSIQVLLNALRLLGHRYGNDRVRLVFRISD